MINYIDVKSQLLERINYNKHFSYVEDYFFKSYLEHLLLN